MPRKSSRQSRRKEEPPCVPIAIVEPVPELTPAPARGMNFIIYIRLAFFLVVLWFVGKTLWDLVPQQTPPQAPATSHISSADPASAPRHKPITFQFDGIKSIKAYSAWASDGSNNPAINRSIHGERMRILDSFFDQGIGTHAPSEIIFNLGGRVEEFSCLVGPDGSGGPDDVIIFKVVADGRKLFESPAMRGDVKPLPVNLKVSGIQKLSLLVDYGTDLHEWGHGDWINIKFVKKKN